MLLAKQLTRRLHKKQLEIKQVLQVTYQDMLQTPIRMLPRVVVYSVQEPMGM